MEAEGAEACFRCRIRRGHALDGKKKSCKCQRLANWSGWGQQGSEAAFGELVRRHAGSCLSGAFDCSQPRRGRRSAETPGGRAWQNIQRFEGRGSFTTGMTRIADEPVASFALRARRPRAAWSMDEPFDGEAKS